MTSAFATQAAIAPTGSPPRGSLDEPGIRRSFVAFHRVQDPTLVLVDHLVALQSRESVCRTDDGYPPPRARNVRCPVHSGTPKGLCHSRWRASCAPTMAYVRGVALRVTR